MTEILSREVQAGPGVTLALSHYPAGEAQARHAHDHVQVSFLLAGEMEERIGRACYENFAPVVCVKPAGADHENIWGRRGALILSVRMQRWDADAMANGPIAAWRRTDPVALSRLAGIAFAAAEPGDAAAVVDDLLALVDGEAPPPSPPPSWLSRVRDAMMAGEALSAEEAARIAGVHRVHLSRSFARHFGLPLSLYRRRLKIARAVEAALRSTESLAEVAQSAGFADQSHMHRALRDTFGTTPRRLRSAFQRRGP